MSTVLFFVILAVFPLYVGLFPPNQAYAVFGVFLVFTFWLYLLGFVFVLGAELNAFLREPWQATALAQATSNVEQGEAQGTTPEQNESQPSPAGRILGFVGLIVAAILLRGGRQERSPSERVARGAG